MATSTGTTGPFAQPVGGFAPAPTQADRRGVEMVLLGFAAAITAVSLVLVETSLEQHPTWDFARLGIAYIMMVAAAHFAVRRFAPYADPTLLPIGALLNGIGLVVIHRMDLAEASLSVSQGEAAPAGDANQQVFWTAVSIAAFIAVLALLRDYRLLARYGYTLGLVGLVALAIPALLPAAFSESGGADIWIRFPGFSIQPGEFSKLLLIVFFSAVLVAKRDLFTAAGRHFLGLEFPRARDLGPILLAWAIAIGVVVLENDFGSSLLIYVTVLVMLYIATERTSWLVLGGSMLVGAFIAIYHLAPVIGVFGHVRVRVDTWLDPFADADNTGYQIIQSLFGLATGGIGGTGLGNGNPTQVPVAKTDFIVAAIGEELGLIGLFAILVLYTVLVIRGLRTAIAIRDSFGKLLASGLAMTMLIQVFVVVGGVTKLIPMTGLTMPLISYGGSSLLANYILLAMLIKISDSARTPAQPKRRTPEVSIESAQTTMVKKLPAPQPLDPQDPTVTAIDLEKQ